jgi:hypothetical protein
VRIKKRLHETAHLAEGAGAQDPVGRSFPVARAPAATRRRP